MRDPLEDLRRVCSGEVVTHPPALEMYGRDASHLRGRPRAAVRPADAGDVERLVRWARTHRIPLVARGGGSSLDGESVPGEGAVVVDFSAWNALLEVDPDNRLARVGPGLVNRDLHRALRPHGLFFPPNPGSWTTSTVGGNVATNAAGPRSFKYGATRRWVAELEVVLGSGTRTRLGGRTTKRSVGPDLLQLLVGSEGILGFLTEVTVHLAVAPAQRHGVVVPLTPGRPVGPLVRSIARWPATHLSAVEYLDATCAEALAVEAGSRFPSDRALVLLEVESGDADDDGYALGSILDRLRLLQLGEEAIVVPDADELWTLRGKSGTALDRSLGERVREDIAVPLSHLDELFEVIAQIGRRHGIAVPVYGHVGDGNLHPNFAVDPAGPVAATIREELLRATRRLQGTISAEHGIGQLKAAHLPLELSPEAIDLLRSVKRACDPDGILNPGKVLPGLSG